MEEIFITVPQISLEDQEKYRGKHVAIIEGKVIAVGYTSLEAVEKAMALFPDKSPEEIILAFIPREEVLIL